MHAFEKEVSSSVSAPSDLTAILPGCCWKKISSAAAVKVKKPKQTVLKGSVIVISVILLVSLFTKP